MKKLADILKNYKDYEICLEDRFGARLCDFLTKSQAKKIGNCMGSGTTAVAAAQEKRKFIGFEKDLKYFEVANARLKKLTGPFYIYGNIGV